MRDMKALASMGLANGGRVVPANDRPPLSSAIFSPARVELCEPGIPAREKRLAEILAVEPAELVHPFDDERIIATAETVYVLVDPNTLKKMPLPADFRMALDKGAKGCRTDHAGYFA
jgi:Na+-translocating ferredoxin:NAD+ oxidoreductase RNF subunit RnfB